MFPHLFLFQEVKVNSPDYKNMNMDMDSVLKDFLMRIEHYQERYEPLEEEREKDLSFMKIYNTGIVATGNNFIDVDVQLTEVYTEMFYF